MTTRTRWLLVVAYWAIALAGVLLVDWLHR